MASLKIMLRRFSREVWICSMSSVLVMTVFDTVAQPSKEYQLKAVFIFNFTQFVDWPEEAFESQDAPLIIGILGENPFGTYLEETIRDETAKGHPLIVQRSSKLEDLKGCHVLFVNLTNQSQAREAIRSSKGKPILTVSDAMNFAKNGGVIRLYTENNKIKIRINLEAARVNNLSISSKLLKLADIVESKKN